MKRSTLVSSLTASVCLGLAGQVFGAQPLAPGVTSATPSEGMDVAFPKPAEKCMRDLSAFNSQMAKDGYWVGGSRYGYGYPVGGLGYGWYGHTGGDYPASAATGYRNALPGYNIRVLMASATILARHGQQQSCEKLLTTTRELYKNYVVDQHSGRVPLADPPEWQRQQLAAAQSVAGQNISYRSDELLGTEVRNPRNEPLGSVDDLVMSPQTGKIAYLVIGRGGVFGIDEKYVPVPWEDFKATPNVSLLVLDTTRRAMDGAPQVKNDQFKTTGHFDQESKKVDAYWNTTLSKQGQ